MSLRIIEFLGNKQLGLEVWGSYVNLANGDKSIKMYDKQKRIYWFVNNWFWWVPDDDVYFFSGLGRKQEKSKWWYDGIRQQTQGIVFNNSWFSYYEIQSCPI